MISGKGDLRFQILDNTESDLVLSPDHPRKAIPEAGSTVEIQIRLQMPYVDPKLCTGCGICEHECPVSGQRAIRVTAENESRSKNRALLLS
jgi:ferredoxin